MKVLGYSPRTISNKEIDPKNTQITIFNYKNIFIDKIIFKKPYF